MLTCTPQYDNNTTVGSAHGRYNAHKTWLIVNTTFTYSYYEEVHTDYLDTKKPSQTHYQASIVDYPTNLAEYMTRPLHRHITCQK